MTLNDLNFSAFHFKWMCSLVSYPKLIVTVVVFTPQAFKNNWGFEVGVEWIYYVSSYFVNCYEMEITAAAVSGPQWKSLSLCNTFLVFLLSIFGLITRKQPSLSSFMSWIEVQTDVFKEVFPAHCKILLASSGRATLPVALGQCDSMSRWSQQPAERVQTEFCFLLFILYIFCLIKCSPSFFSAIPSLSLCPHIWWEWCAPEQWVWVG